jgi:hypothetical protein
MKTLLVLVVSIALMTAFIAGQQKKPAEQPTRVATAGPGPTDNDRERELQDLRQDLQQMRSLLGQMQRNLAATAPGETPLKHQFQLEIDMWQVLIRRMQQRVGDREQPPASNQR